eukprot:TRINITY_DN12365_c0_g2_i1.p1 TRINITY_DN12365_c0_g2~~TRINITY_DN12365_c0_g2_i1.p1  ORF type:complete len:515 (+),score=53.30 TRINITY_DN12365_c0_g2_i1:151-1545(+)
MLTAEPELPGSSAGSLTARAKVAPFRTRWLYFMKFSWGACMGRFMSLYYLAEGLDEADIGFVFAASSACAPFVSTSVAVMADRFAARVPAARHYMFAACIILGSLAFTLMALHLPGVSRMTTMLVCRILFYSCNASADVLADAITLQGLEDRRRFGGERLYGAISWAIVHLALGVLLERFGRSIQHILIILMGAGNIIVLAIIGLPNGKSEVDEEASPGKKSAGLAALTDNRALAALLKSYASSYETLAFLFYAVTLGLGMTIVENLIFLYFRELNASYFLCGVSVVVTVVFEIPLFWQSKALLLKLGAPTLLSLAGLNYIVRVLGYTLIPGGWYVLIFEPMHGVTIAMWCAASVELMASITPPEFTATGQAVLGLLRSGLGSTMGNYFAGAIIRRYNESTCYRSSAVAVALGLASYHAARHLSSHNPDIKVPTEEIPQGTQNGQESDEDSPTGPKPVKLGQVA